MESKQVVFKRNAPFYYSIGVKELHQSKADGIYF